MKQLLILLLLAITNLAYARDNGQYQNVDPKIKEWIKSLTDGKGIGCCDVADGYPVEAIWDIENNHYKVKIKDKWYVITDNQLIKKPNKLGYAIVWYIMMGNEPQIRCFIPGAGS